MFILKFNGIILDNTTEKPAEINTANLTNSTYENRQIIALGRKKHDTTVDSSIKWTISPQKKDSATFRPIPETITLNDGETIQAVIFTINGSGTSSSVNAMKNTKLYIRITNANVVLGKSFIAVIENDVDQKNGQTKIEFLTDINSSIFKDEKNKFLMKDVQNGTATNPLDITNKYFFINEEQKQFNVITLYIHTAIIGASAVSTNTFRAKNDYLQLKKDPTTNATLIDSENKPGDKKTTLNPTFQDFIAMYQSMIKADPNAAIAAMQAQIDAEKAKMLKYKTILIQFIHYLEKYKTRINDHAIKIKNIIDTPKPLK
jgi:hypothetical protein